MNNLLLLTVVLIAFSPRIKSQHLHPHHRCGQSELLQTMLTNPKLRANYQRSQARLKKEKIALRANQSLRALQSDSLITIPVVFHVLYDDNSKKPTVTEIENLLTSVNEFFNAKNAGYSKVVDAFDTVKANFKIKLKLAKTAPDGTCFPGVTYTKTRWTSVESYYYGSHQVNAVIKGNNVFQGEWPGGQYLNVFACQTIHPMVAGYAFYPDSTNWGNTMYSHVWLSPDGLAKPTTIAHEVGHWLNLGHPWGHTNSIDPNYNHCIEDDGVKDTPTSKNASSGCNLTANTCSEDTEFWGFDQIDNVQNIMDYSNCPSMFTKGQKERGRVSLASKVGSRNTLSTKSNLERTGVFNNESCVVPYLIADRTTICQGDIVRFVNESYSKIQSYEWKFTGGTPPTSTEENPSVTYNASGKFDVQLTATNNAGESKDTIFKEYILVHGDAALSAPFSEDFEELSGNLSDNEWHTTSPTEIPWEINQTASVSGQNSVTINQFKHLYDSSSPHYNYMCHWNCGNNYVLRSPKFNLSDQTKAQLSFKYAYNAVIRYDTIMPGLTFLQETRLKLSTSNNCGKTWKVAKEIKNENFITGDLKKDSSIYIPSGDEWKTVTIDLGPENLVDNFQFELDLNLWRWNNFYLDDINITVGDAIGIKDFRQQLSLSIYPNPASKTATIKYELPFQSRHFSISLNDLTGKKIMALDNVQSSVGKHALNLSLANLARGSYFVEVASDWGKVVERLIVQ